ncbi:unnamed protein product [Clonostachys rosea]|uniref:Uncharacterized protein n=1 Tax=Bionectria ochroleuca TaxID=29856 RepID=A0ABY6UD96_BIOOC|nr:unnamed protein product [Clonostachys rosea]
MGRGKGSDRKGTYDDDDARQAALIFGAIAAGARAKILQQIRPVQAAALEINWKASIASRAVIR